MKEIKFELTTEEKSLFLKELIEAQKKDLMDMIIKESVYQEEYAKPTHMGKEQALRVLGEYQKRIGHIKESIYLLTEYARTHEINL